MTSKKTVEAFVAKSKDIQYKEQNGGARGWNFKGNNLAIQLRRQQWRSSVISWASIIVNDIIGLFQTDDGTKINRDLL